MILDKLKELDSNNQWDKEHLKDINPIELLDEIKKNYTNFVPIDFTIYNYIPDQLHATLTTENGKTLKSPFYERLLLDLLYLESKGLDELYFQATLTLCYPAQAIIALEELVSEEKEYKLLREEYDRYCNNSMSVIRNQMALMENLQNLKLDEIKDITDKFAGYINDNSKEVH